MAYELDPKLIDDVQKARRTLAEARELCQRGHNCGFDMAAQNAVIEALDQRLSAINEEFGSGRRNDA